MKAIIIFLLLSLTLEIGEEEEYVELSKYGSTKVTNGYLSLKITDFKIGDTITIYVEFDTYNFPEGISYDSFRIHYLQDNFNSKERFEEKFTVSKYRTHTKSDYFHHIFIFDIPLIEKTDYLLIKAHYYDAELTVTHHRPKEKNKLSIGWIIFLVIFLIAIAIIIVSSCIWACTKKKKITPTITTQSYPLGPVNNSPQGYESPNYGQY